MRWLELLAYGLFAFDVTGSPALVALMVVLRLAPLALFGVVIGALSDLAPPARLLRIGLGAIGAASLALCLVSLSAPPPYWLAAAGAFLSGAFWASDLPVRRKLAADYVDGARLPGAMALDGATSNGMRAAGPLFGGALYGVVGIEGVFALAALCYLAALAIAFALPAVPGAAAADAGPFRPFSGAAEAARLAFRRRDVGRLLLVTVAFNIWGFPYLAMIPVIGRDDLGLSPGAVGAATALEGLFAFLGAMAMMRLRREGVFRAVYFGAVMLLFLTILAMGLATGFWTMLAGLALGGLCAACFAAMQSTLIYQVAPPDMRGRFFGLMTICIGAGVIGFANIGLTAEAFGAADALWITGAQGLIPLALIARGWTELAPR